ncbi:MAG TPA: GNAT family N-acetyltransferase [Ktedonobacterales bacterium]
MTLRPYDDQRDRPLLRAWIEGPQTTRWLTSHEGALTETDLDAWCDTSSASRWIHERDGVPVAYGELQAHRDVPYVRLARLLVDPARRMRGIGRELTWALAAQARADHPGWPIYTRIPPDNLPALLAYPSAGFVPLEPLPPNADASFLWLALPESEPADPGGALDD